MNESINVHYYSDGITVNCCRSTVQMLWVGSLEKCCFQLLMEAGQYGVDLTLAGRVFQARAAATGNAWSPSINRRVDGAMSVDVLADLSRHRASTSVVYFSGQLKCLGEIRRCRTMRTPMSQNTQPVLDPLRDFQPVKFAH